MAIDPDIQAFVDSVGAKQPDRNHPASSEWKQMFRRQNYFVLSDRYMIVKISRSQKPFWGIGRKFIDLLGLLDDFLVVLLTSPTDGWVFTKWEVQAQIDGGHWKLREADDNYKINRPLPDRNGFSSARAFLRKVGLDAGTIT